MKRHQEEVEKEFIRQKEIIRKYAEEKKEHDRQEIMVKQKEEQTRKLKQQQEELAVQIQAQKEREIKLKLTDFNEKIKYNIERAIKREKRQVFKEILEYTLDLKQAEKEV